MSDAGYYDPWPLLQLDRPLALIGFVTADISAVGRVLSSLVGLPFIDVDRRVEHRVGSSRFEFSQCFGVEELRRTEGLEVLASLAERPAGVLALGDGALQDPKIAKAVCDRSRLVHLDRSFDGDLESLRQRYLQPSGPRPGLDPDAHQDALRALHAARSEDFAQAELAIRMEEPTPSHVARSLLIALGWDQV